MDFFERAQTTVKKGVPVIRLRPLSKIALDNDWPNLATTDINVLQKWNQETPDANCGAVAKAELGGVFFLEVDDPSVPGRIERETGQKIPKTYRIRSSIGRGHYYWRQTPESIALGNLAQSFVKNGDFSVRVSSQYVVAADSLHPKTGLPYEIVSMSEIVEAPTWLIKWLESQKVEAKKSGYTLEGEDKIPRGSHDTALTSIAGKLRHLGLEENAIYTAIEEVCEKRCLDKGFDWRDMCKKIAASVCRYPPGKEPVQPLVWSPAVEIIDPDELEETSKIEISPYPVFPSWVYEGTSLYEGFVKPYCDVNSRYEEFLFLPAVVFMLNYLGTRVRISFRDIIPSLYLLMIGRKGRIIKSSSVEDAAAYFQHMKILDYGGPNLRNAEGRTIVWTAGSPEGLGTDMQKSNCKNAVLYYDELSILTNKAGIENSNLNSALLLLYESGNFSNSIKSKKEVYSINPRTYCASLIACCTDRNFKSLWGKMQGDSSGLNDRFFFLYQPETFKIVSPQVSVNTTQGAIKTKELIDKAIQKGVYSIIDSSPLKAKLNGDDKIENRQEIRAVKFALYFAVDTGREEIDEDCIERGLALIEYERAVKKRLRPPESVTKEAAIQNDIIDHLLHSPNGIQTVRELHKSLHPLRYGTSLWGSAFQGLVRAGQIAELGKGTKSDPKRIVLLKAPEENDD